MVKAEDVAAKIDHTILRTDGTKDDVIKLCHEALVYHFASICVHQCWVELAAAELRGSGVAISTVIGFPFGADSTEVKTFSACSCCLHGAVELDMVMNVSRFLSGEDDFVTKDIAEVVKAAKSVGDGNIVKVIIETCYLDDEQKRRACEIVDLAGAQFVKTSTGYGPSGATVEDVKLLVETKSPELEVKASGGIRTADQAIVMISAGASRIGTSSGAAIMEELLARGDL